MSALPPLRGRMTTTGEQHMFRREAMMLPDIRHLFDRFQWPPVRRALEGSAPLAHREALTSISGHHKGDVTSALHAVFVWCRHVILLPGGMLRHVLGRTTMVNPDLMLALIDAPVWGNVRGLCQSRSDACEHCDAETASAPPT